MGNMTTKDKLENAANLNAALSSIDNELLGLIFSNPKSQYHTYVHRDAYKNILEKYFERIDAIVKEMNHDLRAELDGLFK